MAQIIKRFEQDLTKDVSVRQCGAVVYNADDLSAVVAVDLFDGGEPATLTGASVVGSVICPDGATVYVNNGSISGNTARITLTAACFAVPGQIAVCIQLVSGETKTTVLKAMFHVEKSITDEVLDPEGRVTLSVSDLIARINAAIAELPANVVTDYAALTELDTDDLPAGYIVKVLTDSTHGNRKTYYNWTGAAWTYITTDTAGYTTAEVDALLAAKQDTIAAFLARAEVSADGNTLTLTDEDGNDTEFSPDGGSEGPAEYIKSISISQDGNKLTFTDQDDDETEFEPNTGGGEPEAYIKSASVSSDGKTLTLTKKDGTTVTFNITSLLAGKQDTISDLATIRANAEAVSGKQNTISDLSTIRTNATNGEAAYQRLNGYDAHEVVVTYNDDTTETFYFLNDTSHGM